MLPELCYEAACPQLNSAASHRSLLCSVGHTEAWNGSNIFKEGLKMWCCKKKKAKVPFTSENVGKCVCSKCPVQAKSKCVKNKIGGIKEALAKKPLRAEDIPGIYCSTGKATCTDLNPKEKCICGTCPIWGESKLAGGKPTGYFCRDGKAT